MKKIITALAVCTLLVGCDDLGRTSLRPTADQCTDFHTVTYFEHSTGWARWYGPTTRQLCIIKSEPLEFKSEN